MRYLYILSFLLLSGLMMAQEPIRYGKDQCAFCGMTIRDPHHAAIALSNDNVILKFDAIEGLINYLKEHDEADFAQLWVADYANKGSWAEASTATFMISKKVPSPMGAFLSGFASEAEARKTVKKKGGALYTWEEIKRKFKDSRFGLSDHRHDHQRPDGQAPIGVMGDHLHPKGGLMASFRYMHMAMDGYRQSSAGIESSEILNSYMVAPQDMTMNMYMLGMMYAPSHRVTLMLMQNYVENDMALINRMGMGFSGNSSGFGDMRVSALVGLGEWGNQSLHLNTGINLPVGSITERGDTPMGTDMKMPYPMQLGSGTYDLSLGMTFQGKAVRHSWGVQQVSVIRNGRNSQGYRLGNEINGTAWFAYRVLGKVSLSFRMDASKMYGIRGADVELNPMMVPTANTTNFGFERVRTFVGANLALAESGFFEAVKLGIEAGRPILNKVEGMQMDESYMVQIGLRYSH